MEIDTKNDIMDNYISFGKLYVEKKFHVNFEKDSKYLRILNRNYRDVLVQIDMEIQR